MARSRPSVLVVDDDAATRQGLTALLESWGYQASEARMARPRSKRAKKNCPTPSSPI